MGCQVVPVYADQTNGILNYPQQIVTDLYSRNYSPGNLLKTVPSQHSYYILGFNQSYAQARLFTCVIKQKQYFVYSAGRFLVVLQCGNMKVFDQNVGKQRSIMHEDKIIGMDMKGKLCVTATVGGRLILWDIQFFQQKLNIKLQSQSLIVSSLSLTSSYLFCTDSQLPNSTISCYDIRTGKLKSTAIIPTFQPILKGINWGNNRHVTVGGDGVWFCQYSENGKQIQIVKGMFRIYPKTSMTTICTVDQLYIITGSVDGYVFLWAHHQCQKVLKVGDNCITDMLLYKNKLIVGNIINNVRVFEYTIKKKKILEQSQKQNGQITDQFVSVIIDSYQQQPLQAIVVSKLQQNIYYAQTRNGLMFNKMIPSTEYQSKVGYYKHLDKKMIQFQKDTDKYIYKSDNKYNNKYYNNNNKQQQQQQRQQLWLVKCNKPIFQLKLISLHKKQPKNWTVTTRFISNSKKYIQTQDTHLFCFIPQLYKLCYFTNTQLYVSDIANITQNPDVKLTQIRQECVMEFQEKGVDALRPRGLAWFKVKQDSYLMLFFQNQYIVLKRQIKIDKQKDINISKQKWQKIKYQHYQKQLTKQIQIEGQTIKFQQQNNLFRWVNPQFDTDLRYKLSFMHCIHQIQDVANLSSGKMLSLGGSIGLIK